MRESTYINNVIQQGRREGQLINSRKYLLTAIRLRLQDPVPERIRLAVEGTNDLDLLEKWFDDALTATTLADMLAVMNLQP